MATVFETGDSDFFDTQRQPMAIGDTFEGVSGINDTNDAVFVTLTAGQSYTVSLTGLLANAAAFSLFFDDFGSNSARISTAGIAAGPTDLAKDVVLSNDGFSFNFTAPTSGTYVFGQERSNWDAGAVTYQLTVEDFVPSVTTEGNDRL